MVRDPTAFTAGHASSRACTAWTAWTRPLPSLPMDTPRPRSRRAPCPGRICFIEQYTWIASTSKKILPGLCNTLRTLIAQALIAQANVTAHAQKKKSTPCASRGGREEQKKVENNTHSSVKHVGPDARAHHGGSSPMSAMLDIIRFSPSQDAFKHRRLPCAQRTQRRGLQQGPHPTRAKEG